MATNSEQTFSESFGKQLFWIISLLFLIANLIWCWRLGIGRPYGASLAISTAGASFLTGSLIGFIFTLFGDEVEPLGKLRDAAIAVFSGVAGISLASLGKIRILIASIPMVLPASPLNDWLAVGFVTLHFIGGFYFMYLMRKLVLNPELARSNAELAKIQGQVGNIAIDLSSRIPHSLLLRRDYIGEVVLAGDKYKSELEALDSELHGEAVTEFLQQCEKEVKSGRGLAADIIDKAATLHYYLSYFEKDKDVRRAEQLRAIEWINRALIADPLDPSLLVKLGDMNFGLDRVAEAVAIFERLERDDDAPQFVQQWLGYFLLEMPGRERDAIRHSLKYHERFPQDSASVYNAAIGYSELYRLDRDGKDGSAILESDNRRESLRYLREAIQIDPECRATAADNVGSDEGFEALKDDSEFILLTKSSTTASDGTSSE